VDDSSVRRLLNLSGIVAVVFGMLGIYRGVLDVRGRPVDGATLDVERDELAVPRTWVASVDSEFRFYAAWYAGSGLAALYLAQRRDLAPSAVGAIGATWVTAALGRLRSSRAWGRPHGVYVALTGVELIVGGILLGKALPRAPTATGLGHRQC
jgi:hypothetical protein